MLAVALLAASLALAPAQTAAIDAIARRVMTDNHIPGLVLGVARGGRVALLRGYGTTQVGTSHAPDGNTVFAIGSLTKQFTAALVLAQIERGTLSFSTREGAATVDELLAQTSGLPTYANTLASLRAALVATPAFPPGTSWEYSNTNYYLLGRLLESTGRVTYATQVHDTIAAPLHLDATGLAAPITSLAAGYAWDGSHQVRAPVEDAAVTWSAAGLYSSASDLLAWLDALQTGRVISRAMFDRMTTSASLDDGERTGYGYGWYVRDWYGWRVAEHSGNVEGYSSDDAIVAHDGLSIVVLANAGNVWLAPLTQSIVAIVDPPKDPHERATIGDPPQNENVAVTATLSARLASLQLGEAMLVEFLGRSDADGLTIERYRVTTDAGRYRVMVGHRAGDTIETMTITPDGE